MFPLNNEWNLSDDAKNCRAQKLFYTRNLGGNAFKEIFYSTLICSMICIGRHFGGHTLARQHGGQNYPLLISC